MTADPCKANEMEENIFFLNQLLLSSSKSGKRESFRLAAGDNNEQE